MMLDKLATTDLAALAVDSRQRPLAFEATLRAIGVVREEPRRDASDGLPLLVLCRVFAHRVAQASAGAAALALAGGLLALVFSMAVGETHHGSRESPGSIHDRWYAWHTFDAWVLATVTLVVLVYFASYAAAAWRFHRAARQRRTDELLRRADGSSVALPIAGATALVVALGSIWICDWPISAGWGDPPWDSIVTAAIAVVLSIAGAAWVARAVARGRGVGVLAHRGVIAFGVLLGMVAVWIAFRFYVPSVRVYWEGDFGRAPSTALRVALVLATLAAFLVSGGIVVRRRVALEPCAVDDIALLALGGVFAHRAARAAAGVASVAFVGLMLAALAFGSPEPHLALWQGIPYGEELGPGPWYLAHDVVPWAASIIVATAAIYFAGYTVAARRFERTLAGSKDLEVTGRALVGRVDGVSLALAIAGATTVAVAIGSMWLTIGSRPLQESNPGTHPMAASWLHQVVVAIACIAIAAVGVGRSVRGRRLAVLDHPATIAAGILLGLVVLCLGSERDVDHIYRRGGVGTIEASRGAMMLGGTLTVFTAVTALALRRRRRELVITGSSPAPSPAPSAEP